MSQQVIRDLNFVTASVCLGDSALGQLIGEEADGSLNLAGGEGEGALLVVAGETGTLGRELLEHIVDGRTHDTHGLLVDANFAVHLLEDTVGVDGGSHPSLGGALPSSGGNSEESLGQFIILFLIWLISSIRQSNKTLNLAFHV